MDKKGTKLEKTNHHKLGLKDKIKNHQKLDKRAKEKIKN